MARLTRDNQMQMAAIELLRRLANVVGDSGRLEDTLDAAMISLWIGASEINRDATVGVLLLLCESPPLTAQGLRDMARAVKRPPQVRM